MPTEATVEENVLRVGSGSPPQAVAASITKAIFESHEWPTIRAIGHGAVGQATKALAIARGYVATRGIDLAFTVGFENVPNQDNTKEISAIVFNTFRR